MRALPGKRFENSEAESDQRSARRRRRIEGDGRVGVGPVEGLAPLDAIALEIVIGEIAALLARLRHDRPADIAIDEQPRAILGEPFESLGKLIVAENGARLHRLAGGGEDARDIRARGQDRGDDGEQIGLEVGERKALRGRRARPVRPDASSAVCTEPRAARTGRAPRLAWRSSQVRYGTPAWRVQNRRRSGRNRFRSPAGA